MPRFSGDEQVGHDALVELDYVAARERRVAPDRRTVTAARCATGRSPIRKTGDPFALRVAYIHSSEEAREVSAARERTLQKAEAALERVKRGLGGRYYKPKPGRHQGRADPHPPATRAPDRQDRAPQRAPDTDLHPRRAGDPRRRRDRRYLRPPAATSSPPSNASASPTPPRHQPGPPTHTQQRILELLQIPPPWLQQPEHAIANCGKRG